MKCSNLKYSGSETKILSLSDTRGRISPTAAHGAGSQVYSQSSDSSLGHTQLPHQSYYPDISAYN
jgi:hypothetical protein